MDSKRHILDRPLGRGKQQTTLSAFAFLFSEMVQYAQSRVLNISDLEKRLEDFGYAVGIRVAELQLYREKPGKRETKLLAMLQFIVSTCWKSMFNKTADALERSTEKMEEYMIHENEPLTNTFISVPPDLGQLNCAAYIAGIIRGILTSGGFDANVTAHSVEEKTVFLIRFEKHVMERDAQVK